MSTQKQKRVMKSVLFAAVVLAVIGAFILLSQRPVNHPPIPQDAQHQGLTEWKDCLRCHGPNQVAPLKASHPLSNEKCFRCHAFPTHTSKP
jgi:uncharacterized paraquat-inducible protein A